MTGINKNSTNKKQVKTVIRLAVRLGMDVIAEGVETKQENTTLEQPGCLEIQGHLFSNPFTLAAFNHYLSPFQKAT